MNDTAVAALAAGGVALAVLAARASTPPRRADGGQLGFDLDAPPLNPARAPARITITHAPDEGTLVSGTTRDDAPHLKAAGFRWSRNLGSWFLPNSRDRRPDRYRIDRLVKILGDAGIPAELEIDDTLRPTAEREAARGERLEERQERLETRGERIGGAGQEKWERSHKMYEAIPFGQPILVGHHSERRDRNYRDRAGRLGDRGREEMTEGRRLTEAADSSRHQQARRETVPVTLRRIAKLEAERRGYLRELKEGEDRIARQSWSAAAKEKAEYLGMSMTPYSPAAVDRLNRQVADADEELAHWRGVVAAAEATGVKVWGPKDFSKGDIVHHRGRQSLVVRVNPKSVSVKTPYSWTDTVPYDDVTGKSVGLAS